jgi:hypothetical protein
MRLTHTHLDVATSYRVQIVPCERLHGARLDGAVLSSLGNLTESPTSARSTQTEEASARRRAQSSSVRDAHATRARPGARRRTQKRSEAGRDPPWTCSPYTRPSCASRYWWSSAHRDRRRRCSQMCNRDRPRRWRCGGTCGPVGLGRGAAGSRLESRGTCVGVLITRRSQVQILPPLPKRRQQKARTNGPGLLLFKPLTDEVPLKSDVGRMSLVRRHVCRAAIGV